MLEVIIAEHAGFCFGVKRALRQVSQAMAEEPGAMYSLGPLIHNQAEVQRLEGMGLHPVEKLDQVPGGRLVIRSHGVPPEVFQEAAARGLQVIDATCPDVGRVQQAARRLRDDGCQVVIVGEREHPEVLGLVGWAGNQAFVVRDESEAESLPVTGKVGVVAQTTLRVEQFERVVEVLKTKTTDLVVCDTICRATRQRQETARDLARTVDTMVVIGGRESANTGKLTRICAGTGTPTYHVERAEDLQAHWFKDIRRVGVTAGASTPHWIIEEVVKRMVEFDRTDVEDKGAELEQDVIPEGGDTDGDRLAPAEEAGIALVEQPESIEENKEGKDIEAQSDGKAEDVQEEDGIQLADNVQELCKGDVVTGTVVQVNSDGVMVDVGGKSEGVIALDELSFRPVSDPAELVKPGEQIEVMVLRLENDEGHPVLSKKRADRLRTWEQLEKYYGEKVELQAPVIDVVKGGLLVDIGTNGFVPASLVERGYVENLNNYLGRTLRLRIIEMDRNKNKVVLSQKVVLDEENEQKRQETWDQLEANQVRHGTVRRLTNFGAFVDIGGVDGLLHVSEIAWGRVDHPKSVLSEGQELDVKVLAVDREAGKVSLGLKQLQENPWHTAASRYPVGSIIRGKVLRIAPFGAFVEVEPGVEGLVHISQLADRHVAKTEEVVSAGDIIPVKILSVDQNGQRMSLSLREAQQTEKPHAREEQLPAPVAEEQNVTLGELFKQELGGFFDDKKDE